MKLRQKLAAVLAATMVVTAVPVVTMASSSNKLTNSIQYVKEDDGVKNYGYLKIELEDDVTTDTMFYVELNGANWQDPITDVAANRALAAVGGSLSAADKGAALDGKVELHRNADNELQVEIKGAAGATAGQTLYIPMYAEVTEAEAKISIDGNRSVISDMAETVFAVAKSEEAAVKFDDAEFINEDGSVADITVEETIAGTIGSHATKKEVSFEIEDTDYEYNKTAILGNLSNYIEVTRGFSGFSIGAAGSGSDIEVSFADDSTMELTFNRVSATPGRVKAVALPINFEGDDIKVDSEIEITVDGENVAKTTGAVAIVKDYGVTLAMDDEKVVEMVAGQKEDITFSVKENVEDTMTANRKMEVRLEKGAFLPQEKDAYEEAYEAIQDGKAVPSSNPFAGETNASKVDLDQLLADLIANVTNKESAGAVTGINWIFDADDRAVGFEFEVASLNASALDEVEFKDISVYMPLGTEGSVKLSMDGRGIGNEEQEVEALTVTAPVTVTTEAMTVKVGLKDQKGGKITIQEADKEMLKQGEWLTISIDDENLDGLRFDDKPEVKVTEGDLQLDLDNIKQTDGQISIQVKRDSKVASTIEVANFTVVATRIVPEGSYDVTINGAAIAQDCTLESIKAEDFIVVGTPNTEDGSTGMRKGTASFKIGDKKYTVNGEEKEMDAAPYITGTGRTMAPIRYVSDAFGIEGKNILFSKGTVTILAGNRTIQLTNGSNVAILNGVQIQMDEKVAIKEGRTYIPVGEVGRLLGIDVSWDNQAKVATFENK